MPVSLVGQVSCKKKRIAIYIIVQMQLKSNNYDIFSSKYTKNMYTKCDKSYSSNEHNVRGKEQQLEV